MQVPESCVTSAPSISAVFVGAGVGRDFRTVTFGRFCGHRSRLRLPRRQFRPFLQAPESVATSAPLLSAFFAGAGAALDFRAVIFG